MRKLYRDLEKSMSAVYAEFSTETQRGLRHCLSGLKEVSVLSVSGKSVIRRGRVGESSLLVGGRYGLGCYQR